MYCGIEERAKGQQVWVCLHAVAEASLTPDYVRVQVKTKAYCSKFGPQHRGRKKGIAGVGESLLEVQRRQLIGTYLVRDLQQHESVGSV